ncbi:AAA family ATPase [Gordonia sp. CPCC 206044]|uniref:AAA family ATPase n=1 Tax=Gordonia sp. CPCC 206044 TaxID=3140793 RepID=UPI003AF334C7
MSRLVVLSGCSGGGKSTTLAELARRGYPTVAEPGRRIVAEELESGGQALPWVDAEAFARRCVDVALSDMQIVHTTAAPWAFVDRGLVDAVAALQHAGGEPTPGAAGHLDRYHHDVFMTPPWAEIFQNDAQRRHGFEEAVGEYERLLGAYRSLGYAVTVLPRSGVVERADFILDTLASAS